MLLTAGSAVIAVCGAGGSWLLSRKAAAGWLMILAAQLTGLPYDTVTRQWGFIPVTLAAIPASVRGWRRFRRDERKADGRLQAEADPIQADLRGPGLRGPGGDRPVRVAGHADAAARLQRRAGRAQRRAGERRRPPGAGHCDAAADDGLPVPATFEGLFSQDFGFVMPVIERAAAAMTQAPPPLPAGSPSGGISPEALIPMTPAAPSPGPPSSPALG